MNGTGYRPFEVQDEDVN